MDLEALTKIKKNKKIVKKLTKKYDAFLASSTILPKVPVLLGPGLNKAGKFPTPITHNDKIEDKLQDLRCTIKFQLKKVLCLALTVGKVNQTDNELSTNISVAINFLVIRMEKNVDIIIKEELA